MFGSRPSRNVMCGLELSLLDGGGELGGRGPDDDGTRDRPIERRSADD